MEKQNIYQKLSKAKAEFSPLLKDSKNPFFKSKYASLNALMDVIEQPFINNGLLLMQPIIEGIVVTKIINVDNTDEMVTSKMQLPENIDPQKLGSAITYFRRYTLQSLLGLNAQDDDAELTRPKTTQQPEKTQVKAKVEPLSKSLVNRINDCITVKEITTLWNANKDIHKNAEFIDLIAKRGGILKQNGIVD